MAVVNLARVPIVLAAGLLAIGLPLGPAHGASLWIVEPPVEAPAWLFAFPLVTPRADGASGDSGIAGGVSLSDLDALLLRTPSRASFNMDNTDPLTLQASGEDRESADLRVLLGRGERWHLMKFDAAADSPELEAKLTAYGEVAYIPRNHVGAGPGLEEPQEPTSVGIRGEGGGFEGGVEYRSLGKRLERVLRGPPGRKDREGTEVWLARTLGVLRLRLSHSDLSDNVDRNPTLPRTTRTQTAVTAELTLPRWPILGLTYAAGDAERARFTSEGGGGTTERQAFESLGGTAYYYGGGWDVTLSSTYSQSQDAVVADRRTTTLYHDLSLTLRPADSVTVVPALSAGLDRYEWAATQGASGSASIMLSYAPTASRWHAWTFAAYTKSRSSDGAVDGGAVSMTGGVACGLDRLLPGRATVSIEAGYDRYVDNVFPAASLQAAFGLVLLKVAAF